jgi:outer membrane receptor for ferrienterochelin and colicin
VQRVESEDPGPLAAAVAEDDPRHSDQLFGRDERTRRLARIGLGAKRELTEGERLSADVRLQMLGIDDTRTLLLAPGFGDTQAHDEDEIGLWTRFEYDRRTDVSSLVGGIELEHGAYDSRYSTPDDTGASLSEGGGSRTKIGVYGEASRLIANRLRVFAGLRYDGISVDRESGASAWFDQWSPRIGVNLAYNDDPSASGNLYAVWTRSFKAPTLAQLYDERLLPTGRPDEFITISNPELLPQRATGFEVGVLQKFPLKSDWIQGEVSASLYRLDLDDEIDFDLRTFRFGNILESRHDGLEVAIAAHFAPGLSLTHSSTWMDVSFRGGDEVGNRLKNLPAAAMTNTAAFRVGRSGQASVSHHYAGSVYLDDSNAVELPGGSTFDAAVQWNFGRVGVQLAGMNLADANISRVGFLLFDPVTSGQAQYVYPSAGRYLRATVSIGP